MRIAIAEIGQETGSFTPVLTTVDTFRQYGMYEGEALLAKRAQGDGTVAGFFRRAKEEDFRFEPVPLISAWAGASGPLSADTLDFFRERITTHLQKAGKLDGFFFSMHGAAAAESDPDVEGALLEAARAVIGPDVPIISPLDHHGSVTRRMMAHLNGLVGHRTQPHHPDDTGYWAAKMLFAVLRGELRPTMAWHRIPMMSHQEQFLTARGPMKVWFDRARAFEREPKVVACSPFPMQPWLDVPEGGWTTVVVTNDDMALAQQISAELAGMVWDMRDQFQVYESVPVDEAVRRAVAAPRGLVILSDTGDSATRFTWGFIGSSDNHRARPGTGYKPFDLTTWFLEVFPVLVAIPLLALTRESFPLTRLLYWLIFVHALILMVGGHYTYARVPLGFWMQDCFDLARNHYDRIGHIAQGRPASAGGRRGV